MRTGFLPQCNGSFPLAHPARGVHLQGLSDPNGMHEYHGKMLFQKLSWQTELSSKQSEDTYIDFFLTSLWPIFVEAAIERFQLCVNNIVENYRVCCELSKANLFQILSIVLIVYIPSDSSSNSSISHLPYVLAQSTARSNAVGW